MTQPPQWPDLSSSSSGEGQPPEPAAAPPQPGWAAPAPPTAAPPTAIPAQPLYPGASYGAPPGHPHTYGHAYPAYPYQPQARTNGLAIASMVLSIVGAVLLFCYLIGGAPALLGAVLGHVARKHVRERGEAGDGMALAGIIVGWTVAGIAIVLLILAVIFFTLALSTPFDDPSTGF